MYSTINLPGKPPRLEEQQVKKVVKALLKHVKVEQNSKKQKSIYFDLQIAIINIPSETKTKPKLVKLPNPFYSIENTKVCIFTPDPQNDYQEMIQSEIKNVSVIGMKQLKTKYKQFSIKKQLCNEFDVFLAPRNMLTSLCPLLGKSFFEKRKQPAGINIKKGSIKHSIENAVGSTRIMIGNGPSVYIHIGTVEQSLDEIVENILKSSKQIASMLKGWDNIKSIHAKTDFSISIPIYNQSEYPESDSESDSDSEF